MDKFFAIFGKIVAIGGVLAIVYLVVQTALVLGAFYQGAHP